MSHFKLFDFIDQHPEEKRPWSNRWKNKKICANLHCHSHFSLDGGSTVQTMVERAVELEYTHFTLSEHGNVNSAVALYREAEKINKKGNKIKLFHSVEAYIRHPKDEKSTHITIGFKTSAAFQKYCELTHILYDEKHMEVKWGDVKPVMTTEHLEELAPLGIVIGTGCIGSFFNYPIYKHGNVKESRERLEWVMSLVGRDNIYDEWIVDDLSKYYAPAKIEEGKIIKEAALELNECSPHLLQYGQDTPNIGKAVNNVRRDHVTGPLNIKPIVSLDSHYARKKDKVIQDSKNYGSDWIMSNFQHMRGAEEYAYEAKKYGGLEDKFIEELLDNTEDYAEQFNDYEFGPSKEWIMPNYEDSNLKWIVNKIKSEKRINLDEKDYADRLNYEIKVLGNNGVFDGLAYLRTVSEICDEAEKRNILVNTRGSAGGSLSYFAVGASVTDPIKYDLQFERHITLGRIKSGSLPDCDLDFDVKDEALAMIYEMYPSRVLPISVNQNLKPRSAIKDAERFILGAVRQETEILTKSMPIVPQGKDETEWLFGYEDIETGEHIQGYFETSQELQAYAAKNPEIWMMVEQMCGVMRQKSSHPCGLIVTPTESKYWLPVCRVGGKNGALVTAWCPKDLEWYKAVKFDVLGVKKMQTIKKTFELIKQRHGIDLKWGEFDHNDQVFENIYHTGKTDATFQTNTSGIRSLCVRTKPKNIVDISNLIALYRPSTIDWQMHLQPSEERPSGFHGNAMEFYVQCSAGNQRPYYIHPSLEPIFGSTFGVPLFQEQILKLAREVGGYSFEEAENLRRGIGKKDKKLINEILDDMEKRIVAKDSSWTENQLHELREMVIASERYGFNCAHSTSYGIVSYATAWLKNNYPLEFWTAELSVEYGDEDKLREYSQLISDKLLQPSVLHSDTTDFVIEGDKIRVPLCVLKGVGEEAAKAVKKLMHNSLEEIGLTKKPQVVKNSRESTKRAKVLSDQKSDDNLLSLG
jgi:DNA polymerase-3 subunit alpha